MIQHPRLQKIARILLELDRIEKNQTERHLVQVGIVLILMKTTILAAKDPAVLITIYDNLIAKLGDPTDASN